jgi:hypothetical protein
MAKLRPVGNDPGAATERIGTLTRGAGPSVDRGAVAAGAVREVGKLPGDAKDRGAVRPESMKRVIRGSYKGFS